MDQSSSYDQELSIKNCCQMLQNLLTKVKKTLQSRSDLDFLHKYRCNFEISQPQLLIGGQMKKYQLEALEWMINLASQQSNAILADDMGLGKTIQAISYLAYLKQQHGILGKHLIVCPKTVASNWQRQLSRWFPSAKVVLMLLNINTRENFLRQVLRPKKFDIIITSYQGAKISIMPLSRIKWQTLIVDEAHKLKNNESYNFICLNYLRATFRLLLTGTPLSNNLKQLWSLLNFIMPQIFQDQNLFQKIQQSTNTFVGSQQDKLKYQCKIAKYFHEIIGPFFKRRTKKQLQLGLPEKKQMTLFVPLSHLQLRLYRNFLRFGNVLGKNNPANFNIMVPRKICQHPFLFQKVAEEDNITLQTLISSSGKLNVLDKLLKKLISQNHKILVFSQFVIMLDILEEYCRQKTYLFSRIDGNSELTERDKSIKRFNQNPQVSIFLLSTKAGGLGLNLVAADRVIIYDIDWNPQNDLQATDRAYRIGQTRPVVVYRLVTQYSIEERMLELQKYKLIWDELVIQKGAFFRSKKQDPLDNINFNNLSKLGKGEIFHLEPSQNQKTIEQILELGQIKDKLKEQQIRQKLKKTIENGSKFNPFEDKKEEQVDYKDKDLQKDQFYISRNYQNDKRQKAKFDRNRVLPAFKFYVSPHQIKDIQFQIHMQAKMQNPSKKVLQILHDKLLSVQSKGLFHDWTQTQFERFVQSHGYYQKTDYQGISKHIESKNPQEVQKYSINFFQKAPNNQRLINFLKNINLLQSKFKQQQKLNAKGANVKHVPQKQISQSKQQSQQQKQSKESQKSKQLQFSQKNQKYNEQSETQEVKNNLKKRKTKEQIQKQRQQKIKLKLQRQQKKKQQQQQRKKKKQQEMKRKQQQKRLKEQQKIRKNQERQQKKKRQALQREQKKKKLQQQKMKREGEKILKKIQKQQSKKKGEQSISTINKQQQKLHSQLSIVSITTHN